MLELTQNLDPIVTILTFVIVIGIGISALIKPADKPKKLVFDVVKLPKKPAVEVKKVFKLVKIIK